jgi:FkbM family methyltransferase
MLKSLAAQLPVGFQFQLKRAYFRSQIWRQRFTADEPEYSMLKDWLSPGDVVIDVGANIGQYTRRMADLVGPRGSVIALEPMQETFRLLTANVGDIAHVTLLKLAASDVGREVFMDLPVSKSGLSNYYRAAIADGGTYRVRAILLDSLGLNRLSLIKIDAEGHELQVLQGARMLLEQFHPRLIVEASTPAERFLREMGYTIDSFSGSPNFVAQFVEVSEPAPLCMAVS